MKVKALLNQVSSGKDKRVYCKAGDELDVISNEHGNVLIVSFKDVSFPIRREECSILES
jgi:hypothetical protein